MNKIFVVLWTIAAFFFVPRFLLPIYAADQAQLTYSTGVVRNITEQTEIRSGDGINYTQKLEIAEDVTGRKVETSVGSETIPLAKEQIFHVGQRVVVVSETDNSGVTSYHIEDQYRIPTLLYLTVGFFVIVLIVSRVKGLTSLIAMGASIAVLVFFMVPQIVSGANPVVISLIASTFISAAVIYLGHGFHYRSHIAFSCMIATLAVVALLSSLVVQVGYLNGIGDETATYLQFSGIGRINLQGLLLGGIILAALSVLDDSVVSQVSIIYQLKSAKKAISFKELFLRGMEVGKDHISSLVNTLVLAYAGASLPLFILLSTRDLQQPLWVALNQQMIAEEVVRTLTGSIGLVLSIPLTTLIAAYVIHKK